MQYLTLRLNSQTAAIVGDRLFFSSGAYGFDGDADPLSKESIYWMHLNDTIDVTGPIDMSLLHSSSLPTSLIRGPSSGGFSGDFLYDKTLLYAYGGVLPPESDDKSDLLWSFNTTSNAWNEIQVQGGKIPFTGATDGVHASDPDTGTAFYTGGWNIAFNGSHNGTVKFQSFNSASPQWYFMTALDGIQGPNIMRGASTCDFPSPLRSKYRVKRF